MNLRTASPGRRRGNTSDDLATETVNLEQCLYRRNADFKQGRDKTDGWRYHNHVLQGKFLRYMVHPIRRKRSAAGLRLVLVSGKVMGRMKGIRIHPRSDISTNTLGMRSGPEGHMYLVNVSGIRPDGHDETWQLACPSEEVQQRWAAACMEARESYDLEEANGVADRLRSLASSMRDSIPVRSHVGKFRIYRKCFSGPRAVKWLQKELQCSSTQAIAVGNRMLNTGLFHHVHHQHMFNNRMHLYRFGDPSSNTTTEDDEELEEHPWRDAFESCRVDIQAMRLAFGLLQTVSDNLSSATTRHNLIVGKLTQELRVVQFTVVILASVTIYTNMFAWDRAVPSHVRYQDGSLGADEVQHSHVLLDIRFGVLLLALVLLLCAYMFLNSSDMLMQDRKLSGGPLSPSDSLLHLTGEDEGDDFNDDMADGDAEDEVEEDFDDDASLPSLVEGSPLSKLPPPSAWPNFPVLVRRGASMLLKGSLTEAEQQRLRQPLNVHGDHEFSFETEHFEGTFSMSIQGLVDTPDYARSGRTPLRIVVQGRFRRPLNCATVHTGYAYDQPINPPTKPAWLTGAVLQISRQIQPNVEVHLKGDKPFALAPVISAARVINVSRLGEEPSITGSGAFSIEEDLSLMDRSFLGMSSRRRKTYFHKKQNVERFDFDADNVYTFVFADNQVHLPSFRVDLGFMQYSLRRLLGTMPLQSIAVVWDPTRFRDGQEVEMPVDAPRLWELEIFHEKAVVGLTEYDADDNASEFDGSSGHIITGSSSVSSPRGNTGGARYDTLDAGGMLGGATSPRGSFKM